MKQSIWLAVVFISAGFLGLSALIRDGVVPAILAVGLIISVTIAVKE